MARSRDLARLSARLEAIPKAVREAIQPALGSSGEELADAMRALAPVDEGDLKGSITVTRAGQTTPAYSQPGGQTVVPENAVMVTVGNDAVRYPHLQEYGTRHHAPRPFFWPAFRLKRKRIEGRIKRAISKAVREGWGKA